MLTKVKETAARVRSSLWFIPGLVVIASLLLAVALIALDSHVSREALIRFPRLFGAGAEGSRGLLAAIASSMITVAGVTFSITIVAVSQASTQYSSRILRNFMTDPWNQLVLGVFVGVFAYCLIVIRTIRGEAEIRFIPAVSVVVAILLALVAIGFRIFFIHHIAQSLQASHLLARVRRETTACIERVFPEPLDATAEDRDARRAERLRREHVWRPVPSDRTGYIQSVDDGALLRLAVQHRVLVRVWRGVGDFVVEGAPIAAVADGPAVPDTLGRKLNRAFVVGTYRTMVQDVGFGLQQVVDVALKALSPGINDTTTAVTCVDQLGAILSRIADRRIEAPIREHDGDARVIAAGASFRGFLATAFDEIRRNARGNVSVLESVLAALETVASFTREPGRRADLAREARRICDAARGGVAEPHDFAGIAARCARLQDPSR